MSPVRRWRWDEPPYILHRILARGGILAVPTESSYALAVDPCNPRAVEAVYQLKGRADSLALPVAIADRGQLERLGVDTRGYPLATLEACWPAALTAVMPLLPGRELAAAGAAGSVAVRIPDHAGLRRLLAELGPLTVTSANRSGEAPLTDPEAVVRWLAATDAAVVEDGMLPGGAPSTLVDWRGDAWTVLRRGRFDPAVLLAATRRQEDG